MHFWIVFWQITFFVTMALFAILAVTVTIGGFRDIKKLFARIDESHRSKGNTGEP